jgi:hypothetical protein
MSFVIQVLQTSYLLNISLFNHSFDNFHFNDLNIFWVFKKFIFIFLSIKYEISNYIKLMIESIENQFIEQSYLEKLFVFVKQSNTLSVEYFF